jgi:hypothetical protein
MVPLAIEFAVMDNGFQGQGADDAPAPSLRRQPIWNIGFATRDETPLFQRNGKEKKSLQRLIWVELAGRGAVAS